MDCELNYSLIKDGEKIESGDGKAIITQENLSMVPSSQDSFSIPYQEILKLSEEDYEIHLRLASGEKLKLSKLGHKFELFLKKLTKNWNEVVLKRLLMSESLKYSGPTADLVYQNQNGVREIDKEAKVRLYETGLVLLVKGGTPKRIPYGDIENVTDEDYTLTVETGLGERISLSKMGRKYDSFKKELFGVMNELDEEMRETIKTLVPSLNSMELRKASRLLKDGKAAKREDLKDISPKLWEELENGLGDAKKEYDFLKTLGQEDDVWIGLKKGLMGDLTEQYLWFLIPLYGTGEDTPGNALAMEATSLGEDSGKATYFFQMFDEDDYALFEDVEEMREGVDDFVREINRCMLDINFRREPIYLSEENLKEPRYSHYQFSIENLPSLRGLRNRFLGRVIHSSNWGKNVLELLRSEIRNQVEGK